MDFSCTTFNNPTDKDLALYVKSPDISLNSSPLIEPEPTSTAPDISGLAEAPAALPRNFTGAFKPVK